MKKLEKKMTVELAFQEFVAVKSQTVTADTLENYISAYQVFCSETGSADEPLEFLNKRLVEDWKMTRLNSSSPLSSSNQYIAGARVFLYWLMEMEYIPHFPIKLIRYEGKLSEPERYTEDEIIKLLEPPKRSDRFVRWREWMIINIMMATGARIGSIIKLKINDISEDTIRFSHTKTHKVLSLPISPSLRKALDLYLGTWEFTDEWLIPTQTGSPSHDNPLRYGLREYCLERGVPYRGFHAFRRAFAYLMWKGGTDIVLIESWLGHSRLETTRQYVGKLTGQDLMDTKIPLDSLMSYNSKKVKRKK